MSDHHGPSPTDAEVVAALGAIPGGHTQAPPGRWRLALADCVAAPSAEPPARAPGAAAPGTEPAAPPAAAPPPPGMGVQTVDAAPEQLYAARQARYRDGELYFPTAGERLRRAERLNRQPDAREAGRALLDAHLTELYARQAQAQRSCEVAPVEPPHEAPAASDDAPGSEAALGAGCLLWEGQVTDEQIECLFDPHRCPHGLPPSPHPSPLRDVHNATAAPTPPPRRARAAARRDTLGFVTFNGGCWANCRAYLEAARRGPHAPRIVAAQELRLDGDDLRAAERWCACNGWRPYIAACRRLASGMPSAGVGLFIRKHVSVTLLRGVPAMQGHVVIPHFAVMVHVDTGIKGGLLVGSVYLEDSQPHSPANQQRLHRCAEVLAHQARPFVIGGDWNQTPADLSYHGWTQRVHAHAHYDHAHGTCRGPTGRYSTYDYWLVSSALAPACGVPRPTPDWPAQPHLPMQFALSHCPRAHCTRQLVIPRR